MDLRPVGAEHRHLLAAFSCATRGSEFTLEVEQQVRTWVPVELESGQVQGLGSWNHDELAALITFSSGGWLWKVTVLATDVRYRRRRQAERLKREVLRRAADAGAEAVVSHVHRANVPMLALNEKLGGVVDAPADADNPYLVCTVPVRR